MKKTNFFYFLIIIIIIIFCSYHYFSLDNCFISMWDTRNEGVSNSTQLKLPLEKGGNYNFTIDWGDGCYDNISFWNQSEIIHNYKKEGIYIIKIDGIISGWRFNNQEDQLKIISIFNWGSLNLGNNGSYFSGARNLKLLDNLDPLNLKDTNNLSYMFFGANYFNGNLSNWDVSNVINMSHMFRWSDFDNDLSNWDVSNVIDMSHMFVWSDFDNDLSNWDVSNVIDMSHMFEGSRFNGNLSNWNVSNVINMSYMFKNSRFNGNLSNWNIVNLTNTSNMFLLFNF